MPQGLTPQCRTRLFLRELGIGLPDGLNIISHSCWDDSNLADLGTTPRTAIKLNRLVVEADYVFSIGTIEPHIIAGLAAAIKISFGLCRS